MRSERRFLILIIVIQILNPPAELNGAEILMESVSMADGSVFSGVVLEHRIGEYLVLSDHSGDIRCLPARDIVSIEHTMERYSGDSHDVFFLSDGLILRGHLVRYLPGGELTLLVKGEQMITLDPERVIKIVHIHMPVPEADTPNPPDPVLRREAVNLQLEIKIGEKKPVKPKENDTRSDIESLAEEIEELEECLEEAEMNGAEIAGNENEEYVVEMIEGINTAIEELTALAEACEMTGPTRTKGPSAVGDPERDAVEFLQAAISAPSHFTDLPLSEVVLSVSLSMDTLAQHAITPAASFDKVKIHESNAQTTQRIQNLLSTRKRYGPVLRARVGVLSAGLPEETRRSIYETNRHHDALNASVLNLIPVLNWGSWRQGDRAHALTNAVTSALIYAAAWSVMTQYAYEYTGALDLQQIGEGWQALPPSPNTIDYGFAVIGVTYLYSLVRPFWYSHRQNARLARALNIETRGPQW